MENTELYARVKDGKIVEFPVMKLHIENRGHPLSWYVLCNVANKPSTEEFQYVRQVPTLNAEGGVDVTWGVQSYTLDQLLNRLPVVQQEGAPRRNGPVRPAPTEALINRIKELATERVQSLLDQFAGSRGYGTPVGGPGSLESAISYIGDKNAAWAADGTFCKNLRSDVWSALFQYFSDVTASPQVQPWPADWQTIKSKLPALTWPAAE